MKKIFVVLLFLIHTSSYAYDVIVIGLGAMGSAATYQLAKAGVSVLGIDRLSPPHIYGSSHGGSRITRLATGEGAEYVPLALRSQQLWHEIADQTKYDIFHQTGGLIMSVPTKEYKHSAPDFLEKTINAAHQYNIEHSDLSAEQIQIRYPQFKLTGTEHGYYEPTAGFLRPGNCIHAQLKLAHDYGAIIKSKEQVFSYVATPESVTVVTNKGKYKAKRLIITAGPWIKDLLPEYKHLFKIYRQTVYWFDLQDKTQYEAYNKLPIFIWAYGDNIDDFIYGFPAINGPDGGLKVATENFETETSPNIVNRKVSQQEIDHMHAIIKNLIPGLSSHIVRSAACLYTATPDYKFIIDFHPKYKNVIVASPCSGHGFKHSAAIGEVLMQLATQGKSDIDISAFSFKRFDKANTDK